MPAGRPTKWNPETMLPILDQCAEEGMFRYEVADALDVDTDTLVEWEKRGMVDENYASFSVAIKRVDRRAAANLERIARLASKGDIEVPNPALLIFTLKNKAAWRDRQEVEQTVKGDASITVNLGGARSAGELDGGNA